MPDDDTNNQPDGISLLDLLRAIFAPQNIDAPLDETQHPAGPVSEQDEDTLEPSDELSPTVQTTASQPPADNEPISSAQAILTAAIVGEIDTIAPIPKTATPPEPVAAARRIGLVFGPLGALLLGYLAQSSLSINRNMRAGALFYVLAIALWLATLAFEFGPPDDRWGWLRRTLKSSTPQWQKLPRNLSFGERLLAIEPARLYLAAAGMAFSALTYVATANNRLPFIGVVAWLGSIILWIMVLSERNDVPQSAIVGRAWAWLRRPTVALQVEPFTFLALAVLLIAAFFRLFQLDAIPGEMTSDHVEKLLDAFDVQNGFYHVFFPRNGGREAIQMYLVALFANVFGTGMSFISLKLVSALEGLLLIPVIIVLGRELIDRETGLLAALLVAVSWWHTSLSRLGLRITLTPLVTSLVLINLLRGLRSGQRKYFIAVGLWLGVGVYSYQALRMLPLVVILGVGLALLSRERDWQWRWHQMGNLFMAGVIAVVVFVPMARFWVDQPDAMWNRVVNRLTANEIAITGSPFVVFLSNLEDALLMFNWRGDIAWISAIPNTPFLDVLTGPLLLLGLSAWLLRLAIRRDPIEAIVPVSLFIMLLPSALAIAFPIENPSATRASGMIALVYLLAAWPLTLIRGRWRTVFSNSGSKSALALIGMIGLLVTLFNYRAYFVRYAESYRTSALNPAEVGSAVAGFAESIGSLDNAYLQGYPFWHDYRAIGIEAGDITWNNAILDVEYLTDMLANDPELSTDSTAKLFIVHPDDQEARAVLAEAFPRGMFTLKMSSVPNRDFYIFVVPAESPANVDDSLDVPIE